jgi:hypothetical protein
LPRVWAGTGIGKDVASDHIFWTDRLLSFALFALHGVRDMGKRLVTRPRGHLGGKKPTAVKRVSVACASIIWLANNRNFLKANVFLNLLCISCLLNHIPEKRTSACIAVRMFTYHLSMKEIGKEKAISRIKIGRSSSLLRA